MTFDEAVALLEGRAKWGMRPGLERIAALTEALGRPQDHYPVVHVAGTNGKFSVVRMTAAVLERLGLTVGAYTSPHLEHLLERIAVAGEPVGEREFAATVAYLEPYLSLVEREPEDELTYFELLTATAFETFFDRAVHVAVVETGLGGEYDATNVADAKVAVVTNVTLDHVAEFGGDLRRAAWEKSGIAKPGSVVVTGVDDPDLLGIVRERAAEREAAAVWVLGEDVAVLDARPGVGGQLLRIRTPHGEYEPFLSLHGRHQAANAALALGACEAFAGGALSEDDVADALGGVSVPGRLQVVARHPLVLVDGGHNPAAARVVVEAVRESFAFARATCVLAMLEDKLIEEVAAVLAPHFERFVLAAPRSERAADPRRLALALQEAGAGRDRTTVLETVGEALADAHASTSDDDLLLVFGSFYTAGEALAWLRSRGLLQQA